MLLLRLSIPTSPGFPILRINMTRKGPIRHFFCFLELSEIKAQGGVVTNQRRMDVLCELAGMSYIFELKVDQKASIAMRQALGQE